MIATAYQGVGRPWVSRWIREQRVVGVKRAVDVVADGHTKVKAFDPTSWHRNVAEVVAVSIVVNANRSIRWSGAPKIRRIGAMSIPSG